MRVVENYTVKHLFIFCLIFSLTTSGYGIAPLPMHEIVFDEEAWWLEDENDSYDPAVNSTQMSDSDCGEQPGKDLLNIYQVNCPIKFKSTKNFKKRMCNCIENAAADNFLVRELKNDQTELKKQEIEMKRRYTRRFKSAYSQMTVEAAVQSKLLGLSDGNEEAKEVGCPPQDIENEVNDLAEKHYKNQNEILDKLLNERNAQLNKCKASKKASQDPKVCDDLVDRVNKLQKMKVAPPPMNVKNTCGLAAAALTKEAILDRLKEAVNFYSSTENSNPAILDQAKRLIAQVDKDDYGPQNCPQSRLDSDAFFKVFDAQLVKGGIRFGVERQGQCETESGLCTAFEKTNANLALKIKDRFQHDLNKCFSYAEFKMFKGMPGDALLRSFSNWTRGNNHAESLLDTPVSPRSELGRERLDFLRANPIIAQLAQNDETKPQLAKKMRKFSKSMVGKSPAEKLKGYLEFMKKDVAELMKGKDTKSTKAFICLQLVKNFTAIQVANDLPDPEQKDKKESQTEMLFDAIKLCQRREHNENATTNIKKTLETSAIFNLAPEDPIEQEKKDKDEYDEFIKNNCAGYKEKCGETPTEDCRQDYLNSNDKLSGANNAMRTAGVKAGISNQDMDDVTRSTDKKAQDTEFKSWWEKNVRPQLSDDVIAFQGEEKKFAATQKADYSTNSSAEVPERFSDRATSLVDPLAGAKSGTGGPKGGAAKNETISDTQSSGKQYVPDFKQPEQPVFDKDKLRAGAPIEKAIPSLAGKSPTEQVELLERFKQNLPEADKDLIPKLEEAQELAQAEIPDTEEVEKKDKQKEKDVKKIANTNSGPGNRVPQRTQASGSNAVPLPVSATTPRVDLARVAKKDKTLEQLNQTLVDVNEQGDKGQGSSGAQTRAPASVNEIQVSLNTPAIVVEAFAKNEDLPKTDKGILIVRDEDLVIKDNYNDIVNDRQKLSAFVRSSLVGEQIGSEVVRVTDSKSGLQTLLLVNPGKHGLIIKRVDRIATYNGLIYANSAAAPQTP